MAGAKQQFQVTETWLSSRSSEGECKNKHFISDRTFADGSHYMELTGPRMNLNQWVDIVGKQILDNLLTVSAP